MSTAPMSRSVCVPELPRDDRGLPVPVPGRVRRVVSIVPSLTEAIETTAPGLVVGATDWCTHPAELAVARVRGTKNPDLEAIVALQPDVVIANEEENKPGDLDELRTAGVPVWVTSPTTVPEALDSLERMLTLACRLEVPDWLQEARAAWDLPEPSGGRTALIPIWRKPWMALGRDTFAGDVLMRLGVRNVLADDAERYPKIALDDVRGRVDLVVLPDEPYAFSPADGPDAFTPDAGWDVDVRCVSGRHLTWYGPSLVEAAAVLREQLQL